GGDYRDTHLLGKLASGLDVHAAHHSVSTYIGKDQRLDAGILEALCHLHGIVLGHLGPAVGSHFPVLGVQPHDDVPGKLQAGVVHEVGRAHRLGAYDHVVHADIQVRLNHIEGADTA